MIIAQIYIWIPVLLLSIKLTMRIGTLRSWSIKMLLLLIKHLLLMIKFL